MPSTAATASGTAAGSATAASSKNQTPSGNSSASARRDFGRQAGLADPAHPGQRHQPMSLQRLLHLGQFCFAPDEARRLRAQVSRRRIERSQGAETRYAGRRPGLETSRPGLAMSRNRRGPKSIRSMPLSRPGRRCRRAESDRRARRHHPRRTVEHRTEVVPVPQLGLTGRHAHPHRQLQRPLRSDRRIDRRPRRRERGSTRRHRCA